jgi:ribosome recycling factor
MLEKLKKENTEKMDKAVSDLHIAFGTIRTGRASVSLVDHLQVEAYGSMMPLQQIASIGTPDARTIAIQPFDSSQIKAVEKAIQVSDIGLTPSNDGKIIRLTIPSLTEERRKELVKLAKKYTEEHRVSVRQIRHLFLEQVKKLEKDKVIGEDQRHTAEADVQKLTDSYIIKLDTELKKKEADIMEV